MSFVAAEPEAKTSVSPFSGKEAFSQFEGTLQLPSTDPTHVQVFAPAAHDMKPKTNEIKIFLMQ